MNSLILGLYGVLPRRVLLKGNLKREQSFDSLFWDMKSSSPKHDLISNLDDLKRQPLSGSVWDGKAKGIFRPSDALSMQPKPKLAKHKLLKKQQSMFAIVPDHNQQQPCFLARDIEARKAELLAKIQSANRQLMNTPTENPSENEQGQKRADVSESTICAIA